MLYFGNKKETDEHYHKSIQDKQTIKTKYTGIP